MYSKKGQVAFGLLIILALALAGAALYTMLTSNTNLASQSGSISLLTNELEFSHQYIRAKAKHFGQELVSNCASCSQEQLATFAQQFENEQNLQILNSHNFFAKLRNGQFTFTQNDTQYSLQIEDIFVSSQKGNNKLTRNFDICQKFDESGDFLGDCDNPAKISASEESAQPPEPECTPDTEYGPNSEAILNSLTAPAGYKKEYACGELLDGTVEGAMFIDGGQRRRIYINPNGVNPCEGKKDLESCIYFVDQNIKGDVSQILVTYGHNVLSSVTEGTRGFCCDEVCVLGEGNCCKQVENYKERQIYCFEYALSFPHTGSA